MFQGTEFPLFKKETNAFTTDKMDLSQSVSTGNIFSFVETNSSKNKKTQNREILEQSTAYKSLFSIFADLDTEIYPENNPLQSNFSIIPFIQGIINSQSDETSEDEEEFEKEMQKDKNNKRKFYKFA